MLTGCYVTSNTHYTDLDCVNTVCYQRILECTIWLSLSVDNGCVQLYYRARG